MAGKRLAVQKQQEILRLKKLNLTDRAIARALNCSRNTVKRDLEEHREANNHVTPKAEETPFTGQINVVTFSANSPEWIKFVDWEDLHKEYLRYWYYGRKTIPLIKFPFNILAFGSNLQGDSHYFLKSLW